MKTRDIHTAVANGDLPEMEQAQADINDQLVCLRDNVISTMEALITLRKDDDTDEALTSHLMEIHAKAKEWNDRIVALLAGGPPQEMMEIQSHQQLLERRMVDALTRTFENAAHLVLQKKKRVPSSHLMELLRKFGADRQAVEEFQRLSFVKRQLIGQQALGLGAMYTLDKKGSVRKKEGGTS